MIYSTNKLKDITIIKTGKLDSNASTNNGAYPFFTCDPITHKTDTYSFDTEAVLLAGNNASGNFTAKYYKGKFDAYQRTYVIQSNDDETLNVRYLGYAINRKLGELKAGSSGSTTKFLTIGMLHNLEIPFPSIIIQRRIADILSAYDDLIENNQRQIKLLEEAAMRLYKEWFVYLRFPGHENIQISNGVPEGWERLKFSCAVDIMSGGTPPTSNTDYYGGEISFYTPKDSNDSFFVFDTLTHITEKGLMNCHSSLFPIGTVIITARGTVGRTSILATPMAMNQSCYALKSEHLKSPYYLFFALNEEVSKLKAMANGGVFDTIIVKTFDAISILVPVRNIIEQFDFRIIPFMDAIKTHIKKISILRQARDKLLPKLMSGEIEV